MNLTVDASCELGTKKILPPIHVLPPGSSVDVQIAVKEQVDLIKRASHYYLNSMKNDKSRF